MTTPNAISPTPLLERLGELLRTYFHAPDSMTFNEMRKEGLATTDAMDLTIGDLRRCLRRSRRQGNNV